VAYGIGAGDVVRVAIISTLAAMAVSVPSTVNAETPDCDTDLLVAAACNNTPGSQPSGGITNVSAGPAYSYTYISRCKAGEGCIRTERVCRTSDGGVGAWYLVRRTNLETGEIENLGTICMEPRDEDRVVITPAMVRREMQRLDWPTAQLEVQPPDGQTLINFETNFFTENTDPTTQTVTLLGQRVEIEATPSEYTWDFGDGTSTTTTSPGAAYPGLDVTHEYADPGRVAPSVDTTYTGRFRINGDAWQPIPGSLTVPGESVALRVRSASPHLVGSY
jgi:hypothetical protein